MELSTEGSHIMLCREDKGHVGQGGGKGGLNLRSVLSTLGDLCGGQKPHILVWDMLHSAKLRFLPAVFRPKSVSLSESFQSLSVPSK